MSILCDLPESQTLASERTASVLPSLDHDAGHPGHPASTLLMGNLRFPEVDSG